MCASSGQHCRGFADWPLSGGARFVYFNEAGPVPDAAEVRVKVPKAQLEDRKELVQKLGHDSFDNMAKPFNTKFDEFKRAAEESTGEVVMGMGLTSMTDIGNHMCVLGRFTEISNEYQAKVRNLQANSPAYQEAVKTAKANLAELISVMDDRIQELKEKGAGEKPEAKERTADTPDFTVSLKDAPDTSPQKFNQAMISNVKSAGDGLIGYLKDNKKKVLDQGTAHMSDYPEAKAKYLREFGYRIDKAIQDIKRAAEKMMSILKQNADKPIEDQKKALKSSASDLRKAMEYIYKAAETENNLTYESAEGTKSFKANVPYEFRRGFRTIDDKVLKVFGAQANFDSLRSFI